MILKKFVLPALIVLVFNGLAVSQTAHNSPINTHRDSVRFYYQNINKAELAIVDSDYSTALSYYKKANKYKWFNAEDLYNAEIVAYLSKDTGAAMQYMNLLAACGLKKSYLEDNRWGRTVVDSPLYKFVSRDYDSIYRLNVNSERAKYGKQMLHFYIKDQSVRTVVIPKDGGRPTAPPQISANAIESDLANRKEMAAFIKANGFPSFNRTGYYDTMRLLEIPGTFWYLWWHSRPDASVLDNIALNAVLDGDFPPEDYAVLMDQRSPTDYVSFYYTVPNIPTLPRDKNSIARINRRRGKMYMEPLDEYEKKLRYRDRDNRFVLINTTCYDLYKITPIVTKELKKKKMSNMK